MSVGIALEVRELKPNRGVPATDTRCVPERQYGLGVLSVGRPLVLRNLMACESKPQR